MDLTARTPPRPLERQINRLRRRFKQQRRTAALVLASISLEVPPSPTPPAVQTMTRHEAAAMVVAEEAVEDDCCRSC